MTLKLDLRGKFAILNGRRVGRILGWQVDDGTAIASMRWYKGGREKLDALSSVIWEVAG